METKEGSITAIESRMDGEVRSPHDAAGIGWDLFDLVRRFGARDPEVIRLIGRFVALLPAWELEDLVQQRADYAIRIAQSARELEYEEMHKLFSLCDGIHALASLGLGFDSTHRQAYENAVRERFRREPNLAHMTAQDRVTDWNRDLWWYKEALYGVRAELH